MEKEHMSSGKILLSCRFRLPGYQQRMRTQDGTQEDSKSSSEDEKIKRILEFCQTPKGILEITEMLGYSGRKPTKKYVKPLVEQGRLAMTIPDKPQSKNQKYVTVK